VQCSATVSLPSHPFGDRGVLQTSEENWARAKENFNIAANRVNDITIYNKQRSAVLTYMVFTR